jgi:hypothetical protein
MLNAIGTVSADMSRSLSFYQLTRRDAGAGDIGRGPARRIASLIMRVIELRPA